ncbi:ECF transporter S component [Clostridium sp.]|uniref:ECF transporter S component n=1 Tax=Clostridium sp. TaxID=1506 RepID=UPI00262147AC|nr:ECF transporter S component [Clostridium sp.]
MKTKTLNTNKFIKLSLLSAIAVVLMYVDFPVIPIFPWLKIDLSDMPALMGAFAFGPLSGIIIEFMKNLLILLVKGTGTGFVGELANFLVGIALVWPAAMIYKKNKTKKTAILGMIVGTISMEVLGILANVYILLPAFGMNMSKAELMKYVTVGLLPFNGIKGILVCLTTYLLYKKVSVSVFKVEPMLDRPMKEKLG